LRHKYPESLSKIGVPKNKRHGVEDSLAERLFTPYFNVSYRKFCKAGFGRVEPKRTQGCLPKSCHSLNLGMENFASILSGRFWPELARQPVAIRLSLKSVQVMQLNVQLLRNWMIK
jgi:hypothetical protein